MTTQVEFYILPPGQPRERYACRLAEDAYVAGRRVFVQARDAAHARTLDDLLWTFRGGSFVPHEIVGPGATATCPVLIGLRPVQPAAEVLINLADSVLEPTEPGRTIMEIVDDDADSKARARDRYRQYRDRGYSLQSHTVESGINQNSE